MPRKPPLNRCIQPADFPAQGSAEEKIRFLLRYAILAPSTHNSQPWRFVIEGETCLIHYEPSLRLAEADPVERDLYISMGCMMENLSIAGSFFGFSPIFTYHLDRAPHIATASFQPSHPNQSARDRLTAITERLNARGIFEKQSLTADHKASLSLVQREQGVSLSMLDDSKKIRELATLTAEGLRRAYRRLQFRKEMSHWMHHSFSGEKDGLHGYALRMPLLLSFLIPTLVRYFDIGALLARLNKKSMGSAPAICVLTSTNNHPEQWLRTGITAERLMLTAWALGLKTSIFVASLEMGDLYRQAQKIIGTDERPQFLFCIGFLTTPQKHTPRYPLEHFFLSTYASH